MKTTASFQEVYTHFIVERGVTDISEDSFERILKVYPGLLVTSSDGFVDINEVDFLASTAAEGTILDPGVFARELKYLYLNHSQWKHHFVKLMKEYCNTTEKKTELLLMMIHAAGSSTGSIVKNILLKEYQPTKFITIEAISNLKSLDPTGQFISNSEKQKIIEIAEELQLLTDEELRNKVYQLFT